MKLPRSLWFVGLFLFTHCVSRTGQGDRFRDSETLAAPALASPPADPDHFSFAIVGDLHVAGGDTARLGRIVTAVGAENDAFLVLLGDIVDKGTKSDVEAVHHVIDAAGWTAKTLYVVGNHDVFEDGWTSFRDLNGPSHFALDAGNSRFVAFDTADGGLSDHEREWLETQLSRPRPKHVFLLSHYLPFIPGQRTYLKFANEREARELMKLASRSGVSAWLGAHYHSYAVGNAEGVDYVVAGGGGGRRMQPVTTNFFVQVSVDGDRVSYQMHPVD